MSGSGITLERDSAGRVVHTFRQSQLGDLDLCLERGRINLAGLMPQGETDSTALGTAVHFAIATGLQGVKDGTPWDPDSLVALALHEFDKAAAMPGFRWLKYSPDRVNWLITSCVLLFHDEVYATVDPILIEHEFGPLTIHEDEERVIRIKGTIDLYCDVHGAVDWKTTGDGRKYRGGFGGDGWKLDRWGPQAPTYIEALIQLGHLDGNGPWPFTFIGFDMSRRDVEICTYPVLRTEGDRTWLRRRALGYALQAERDFSPWPMQDNHALCSPKFCGAWDTCKGFYFDGFDWPLKVQH